MSDPTAFDLQPQGNPRNPFTRRVTGYTSHGGHKLDYPFITEVAPNLYQGGVETGLLLPDIIKHVVSLYPWERYDQKHETLSYTTVRMLDSLDQDFDQIELLAQWVNLCRKTGPVLVHCQAGLNRSSLVVGAALWLNDDLAPSTTPRAIVDHMRATRSPAVLCNPAFEEWVLKIPRNY